MTDETQTRRSTASTASNAADPTPIDRPATALENDHKCDAHGRLLTVVAFDTIECAACWGVASRQASVSQDRETTHHHYRCQVCPAGGTLVEHTDAPNRQRGPAFDGADSAVALALAYDPAKSASKAARGAERVDSAGVARRPGEVARS